MISDDIEKEAESIVDDEAKSSESISINPQLVPKWHVIRVTYGRECKFATWVKDELGLDCFVPMRTIRFNRKKDGKRIRKEVCAIPNMLFVFASRTVLYNIKHDPRCKYPVRFVMERVASDRKEPMVVPERQMNDFRRVIEKTAIENVLYLDNPDIVFKKGQAIVVTYGPFEGVHGYIMRIRRDRKVIVMLDGLIAAAIDVKKEHVRLLSPEEKEEKKEK